MHYVYMLKSINFSDQTYTGLTRDLNRRLQAHNAGESKHTAKYAPWRLITYLAFEEKRKAEEFEHYLKSGSGRAFARKRLW
jgi:putative endonuclease